MLDRAYSFTSVEILKRLVGRFDLQDYPIAPDKSLLLAHSVIPTTDIDRLLRTINISHNTISITATGAFTVATVPAGKRWDLVHFHAFLVTGTYDIDYLDLNDGTGTMELDKWTAASSRVKTFEQPIPIKEDIIVRIHATNYAVTGNCAIKLLYWEEDAY